METKRMTLWQLVDNVVLQVPFKRDKIEALLQTTLIHSDDGSNDSYDLWMGGSAALQGAVEISNVDLRIKRNGPHPGFMVLTLAGACVTLAEVKTHYADIKMTSSPRGHSVNDTTGYTSQRPWGSLSFSFLERKPDCVSTIAFAPR